VKLCGRFDGPVLGFAVTHFFGDAVGPGWLVGLCFMHFGLLDVLFG
jgi:hypothetical protein